MRRILKWVEAGSLTAVYRLETESNTVELLLLPTSFKGETLRQDCMAEPLVQIKLQQDDSPAYFSGGRTMREGPSVTALCYCSQTEQHRDDAVSVSTVLADPRGYSCRHTLTLFFDNPAAEITTTFYNGSAEAVTLEMLSSFTLGSMSPLLHGLAPGSLTVHRMRSTWSAEGRLVSEPAEDLQLEPSWKNYSANCLRFGSVGSFPVRGYVPFCAVEDTVHHVTWAAAVTQASSWQIELYRKDLGLSISGGLADQEFGHWSKLVAPGQSFEAPKAVVTAVQGNVDAAAQALAENTRRTIEKYLPAAERDLPVLFNEFCTTWGCPTEDSVLAQVKALAGKGIGYYVIDAGWYDDDSSEEAAKLGRWQVSQKAFPHGLVPVVQAIHDAGMKAGIWFEFETVGQDEPDCFYKTEWLLKRHGRPITAGKRRFWDMRKPEVQEYLAEKVIAFLRENHLDYVKVDYNETIGVGCDGAESLGEGLRAQIEASQAFFARLRRELPEIVLEICASGGHRICHSFLELGCMASFSDAHECDEIPIIAANMHRMLLPRQSQIWAVVKAGQPVKKLYYQICSGLLGRLCFSGEPEALSSGQWAVIKRGIAFYRLAAPVIDHGVSQRFGPAVLSYRAPAGWQAVVRRGSTCTLVVLHTFGNAPYTVELPVTGVLTQAFAREELLIRQVDTGWEIAGLTDFDSAALLLQNVQAEQEEAKCRF